MLQLITTVLAMVAALLAFEAADSFRSTSRGSRADPFRRWALAVSWLMLARSAIGLALHVGWPVGLAWFLAWSMAACLIGTGKPGNAAVKGRAQVARGAGLSPAAAVRQASLRGAIPFLAAVAISALWVGRGQALGTIDPTTLDAPPPGGRMSLAADGGLEASSDLVWGLSREAGSSAFELTIPARVGGSASSRYVLWTDRPSATNRPLRTVSEGEPAGPARVLYADCRRSRL